MGLSIPRRILELQFFFFRLGLPFISIRHENGALISETLFKPEKFENAGFGAVLVRTKNS